MNKRTSNEVVAECGKLWFAAVVVIAGKGAEGRDTVPKYKVPGRGVHICRVADYDPVFYDLWWGTYRLCNHIIATREPDRQVIACVEIDRTKYQGATYEEWRDATMSFLKRAAAKDQAEIATPSKAGEVWLKEYAALVEYLSSEEFEDGSPRKTSTISIFVEGIVWKVVLNDRHLNRCLWVSGASLPDVLKALEGLLRTDTGEWRAQKPWTPGKRQKRS